MFESSVISYGSKTALIVKRLPFRFESSVISYGSKTLEIAELVGGEFESSVISYGSKTRSESLDIRLSLRVV